MYYQSDFILQSFVVRIRPQIKALQRLQLEAQIVLCLLEVIIFEVGGHRKFVDGFLLLPKAVESFYRCGKNF